MTSHDISLEKLVKLCDAAGLNPVSLIGETFTSDGLGHSYSLEQERFFAKHPVEFLIFIKCVVGLSFEQIKSQVGCNTHKLIKSLRKLEGSGLASLESKNRIRVKIRGPFRWRPQGTLEAALFTRFRDAIFSHFSAERGTRERPNADAIRMFRPFEMYLDTKTAFEFATELSNVLLRYRSVSHSQHGFRKGGLRPVSGLIAVDFFDAWAQVCLPES